MSRNEQGSADEWEQEPWAMQQDPWGEWNPPCEDWESWEVDWIGKGKGKGNSKGMECLSQEHATTVDSGDILPGIVQ